jgi:hypothetical protein
VLALGLVPSLARADDAVELKYKLARGDKLIYRLKSEMKQSQTIMGMLHENEIQTDTIQSVTVDAIDDKGNSQLSVKGERIKVKANFAQLGDFVFDSQSNERDKSSMLGAALTPLYERLSGATFQAVVSPAGDVVEVKGYADLIRDLVADNPLTAQFARGGTDEAAKENLREIFPNLAKSTPRPGDTWEAPYEFSLGKVGVTKGKRVYRYVGPDKVANQPTVKLDVNSETSISLDIDMNGVKITGTLSTTAANGTVQFDPAAGRVRSSQGSATISGTLNINANGMDIPLQNDQIIKGSIEYLDKLPD